MKIIKYFFIIIFCALIGKAFALEENKIKVVRFDANICQEGDFNRIDVRMELQNTGRKKINFKANTSGSGGLNFYSYQSDGEFCHDGGECDRKIHEMASYEPYGLDVTVYPRGTFLYSDFFIIRLRSKTSQLKGVLYFKLKGVSSAEPKTSFEVFTQKAMEVDSIDQCSIK